MNTPERPMVLVPVAVLEGESVSPALAKALSSVPVELLGYHVLPEQTPPGQGRMQFEEQIQTELNDLAETFREQGGEVETRVVFTHDSKQTFERVAVEESCDAVLLNNPATKVEDVLVPLRGEINVERIVALVGNILEATDATVTLYHVSESDEDLPTGQSLVDDAADSLAEVIAGLEGIQGTDENERDARIHDRVREELVVSETPVKTLVERASDADLVVMGESRPSVRELFFGEVSENVAAQSVTPVLVVRRLPAVEKPDGQRE